MTTKINYNQIKGNVINVFDYMTAAQVADVIAGTAAVDVTTAIQSAVTATLAAGNELFFPAGRYLTTDTAINLTAGNSPVSFRGIPNKSVLVNKAAATKPSIKIFDRHWWSIDGLNVAGTAGYPNDAIEITGTTPLVRSIFFDIRNCTLAPNGIGIHMQDANNGRIYRCHYHPSNGPIGGTFDVGSNTNFILADGGEVDDIVIDSCTALSVATVATYGGCGIKWDCTGQTNAITIRDCELELTSASTHQSIWLNDVYGALIIGNYLDNSLVTITTSYYVSVENNRGAGTCDLDFGNGTVGGAVTYSSVKNCVLQSITDDPYCSKNIYENVTTVNNWGASLCIEPLTINCSDQVTSNTRAPSICAAVSEGNFYTAQSKSYTTLAIGGAMTAEIDMATKYYVIVVEVEATGINTAATLPLVAAAKHYLYVVNDVLTTNTAIYVDLAVGCTIAITAAANAILVGITNTTGAVLHAGMTVKVSAGAVDDTAQKRGPVAVQWS